MHNLKPEEILQSVHRIMKAAEYGFFITIGEDGYPSARLMQPFEPEADLTIWFGANPGSRKIRELQRNKKVTIGFHDSATTAYAALRGSAEVVNDPAQKGRYWRAFWSDIYPGGPEGDEYVLVKFVPDRIEVMDFQGHVLPQPYGLKPNVLERSGASWALSNREDL
ncbi:MAG: hypothetical protein FJ215_08900 [Ignavibacteria bacterium]|nr:hypothetical protein [Ignavibacteria bacterium]